MSVLRGLIIAISTFSRIPAPRVSWEGKAAGRALMFLPVVGVAIGAILLLWHALCTVLPVSAFFQAVGYTILPLLITGAIHLDGFCDTADALASNAEPTRRQEILHDSHVGAFAVIAVVIYILAFVGLATELDNSWPAAVSLAAIFVVSRGLAGLATLWAPCIGSSRFAVAFRNPRLKTSSTVVLVLWVAVGAALLVVCGCWPGVVALLIAALLYLLAQFWLVRQFEGFSGDLAGWLIQMIELGALAGLVFGALVLGLW